MLHYTYQFLEGKSHFIYISFEIDNINTEEIEVQLPAWRPGRYELGNFAKNIREWEALDENGNHCDSKKITKDRWIIQTNGAEKIKINYAFCADKLTAGDSYADENLFYINPVNCSLFLPDRINEAAEVKLDIPENFNVATAMKEIGNRQYQVSDFHELADSPLICAQNIQTHHFEQDGTIFYLDFCGEAKPDFQQLEKDFKLFIAAEIKAYNGKFPVKEYHFIYLILPYSAYHGVEHSNATMIMLGPSYKIMNKDGFYNELLGVSCHELYHTWNIKRIRPTEMFPYQYEKENYSRLGYLYEGATTLYGDLYLLRGGTWDFDQWVKTFNELLKRHFNNYGRLNLSVADSSFDTWLDGYVAGVPNRKVSIYTEGALCTFMLDCLIRMATGDKKSFDDVMRSFYFDFFQNKKGISEVDYKKVAEQVADKNFDDFFSNYINGTKDYEALLKTCLDYYGLDLNIKPAENFNEAYWGMRVFEGKIIAIAPNSPTEKNGLAVGDEILSINNIAIEKNLTHWAEYFHLDKKVVLTLKKSDNKLISKELALNNSIYYKQYHIAKQADASEAQKAHFKNFAWQ